MSCVEGVVNWLKTKKRSENSLAILNDICRFFCATPDSVLFRFLWSVYIGAFSSLLQVFFSFFSPSFPQRLDEGFHFARSVWNFNFSAERIFFEGSFNCSGSSQGTVLMAFYDCFSSLKLCLVHLPAKVYIFICVYAVVVVLLCVGLIKYY